VSTGRCAAHQREARTQAERPRESAAKRGYGRTWQKASKGYLAKHPLCVACAPRVTAATVVDHIRPHRGDKALFWDSENWQALCAPCHSRKTAQEDGGFGNRAGVA
jgi:5-methylcytosine-specific restriction enzyme A